MWTVTKQKRERLGNDQDHERVSDVGPVWHTGDEIHFIDKLGTHTEHPPYADRRTMLEDYRRIALDRPSETWGRVNAERVFKHVNALISEYKREEKSCKTNFGFRE